METEGFRKEGGKDKSSTVLVSLYKTEDNNKSPLIFVGIKSFPTGPSFPKDA